MQEDGIPEEEYEFQEFHIRMRYKRKNIGDKKGETCSEMEGTEPFTLV